MTDHDTLWFYFLVNATTMYGFVNNNFDHHIFEISMIEINVFIGKDVNIILI